MDPATAFGWAGLAWRMGSYFWDLAEQAGATDEQKAAARAEALAHLADVAKRVSEAEPPPIRPV